MGELVAIPLREPLSDEDAARYLDEAGILQKEEFYALSDDLKQVAFTLSEVRNASVLSRCKRQLQKLVKTGGTMRDFEIWLEEAGIAWERWYIEVVYRNAVIGSYNQARWIAMNRGHMKEAFPVLVYDAILDSRTSKICRPLDGRWWIRGEFPQHLYPPNHHQCRSVVRQITKKLADRRPKKRGTPGDYQGPQAGWAGNPATDWNAMANRRLTILKHFLRTA